MKVCNASSSFKLCNPRSSHPTHFPCSIPFTLLRSLGYRFDTVFLYLSYILLITSHISIFLLSHLSISHFYNFVHPSNSFHFTFFRVPFEHFFIQFFLIRHSPIPISVFTVYYPFYYHITLTLYQLPLSYFIHTYSVSIYSIPYFECKYLNFSIRCPF